MRAFALFLFTMTVLGISSVYAQIPQDGLQAYFPFNGNTVDASGNGNDASNSNAVPTTDRFGVENRAYEFNGIDAFLEINNDFDYPERTINLWFYINDIDMHGAIYDTDNPSLVYGQAKVFVTSSNGLDTLEATIGIPHHITPIDREKWHMITLVRDGQNTSSFLNCSRTDGKLNSNNTSDMGPTGTRIGTTRLLDRFFNGKVDDIRIYNRALTEEEITELYREGNPNLKTNAPAICPVDAAEMTPTCADACVVCDIDGFQGRNVSEDFGELPPGFAGECTLFQHKAAWIAFIAGSINLKISMSVANCTGGNGLEIGIYAGTDCGNFRRISNCHGGATSSPVTEANPRELEVFEDLVIGQYYYLVIDATPNADNTAFTTCDWTLTVLEGSTAVFPLNTSGSIVGSTNTCPGQMNSYTTTVDTGATNFVWTINGVDQNINNDSIDISFPADGTYTLCVEASNACQSPPPTCQTIFVQTIEPTTIDTFICESDCIVIADTMICNGGNYRRVLNGRMDCDSIVNINVTEIMTPVVDITLNICEGDTFYIGEKPFTTTGQYQERLSTDVLCDSIVNLDLLAVVCNIESNSLATPVSCHNGLDGEISFEVLTGTAPFTYSWTQIGGQLNGSGNIAAVNQSTVLDDLSPGQYAITINDGFGNLDIILDEVINPDPLLLTLITSDYNGQNISCLNAADGSITSMVSGGLPPYQYLWSDGSTDNSITNLSPNMYTLEITDALGCRRSASMVITEPMPLNIELSAQDPTCDGLSTGTIEIVSTFGGSPPYRYSIDGLSWQMIPIFNNLTEGNYEVVVEDANACIVAQSTSLEAPEIPIVDLGEDQILGLGDSLDLQVSINNLTNPNISWTPDAYLSCTNCTVTNTRPLDPIQYIVTAISVDGCVDIDSIFIDVQKLRKFYAPNAFSPDQDGINDVFYISGSSEVAGIAAMKIFDRWGSQLFTIEQVPDNDPNSGWDGTFNGQLLNTGIYIWTADIVFIDGQVITYSGDITLLR